MTKRSEFYRSLASMHRAGIPWTRAVPSAAGADGAFAQVGEDLAEGRSLAEAFEPVLDPLDVALVEAGERDGSLEETLERLAEAHEARHRRRSELQVRQIYPRVLAHVAALLMAVPDLVQGRPLSALGWALSILVPLYVWLFVQRQLARRERPAPTGEPPAPPPRIGELRNRVDEADARGLEALGRLYDAGVPLGQALPLAMRAGWGGRVAQDLATARVRVERGETLHPAFTHLDPERASRIRTAEEAGALGSTLQRMAEELRYGADVRRRKTAQIVPVLMILAIGAIILLRLVAFYGAYYSQLDRLSDF